MYVSDNEMLKKLKIEDLEEQYAEIAEEVGIDGLLKLVKRFSGTPLYIPSIKVILKKKIYNAVLNDYCNGENIADLTKKYSVCEATVYNILRKRCMK